MKKKEYNYLTVKYNEMIMDRDKYIKMLQNHIDELTKVIVAPKSLEPMEPITVCAMCAKKLVTSD